MRRLARTAGMTPVPLPDTDLAALRAEAAHLRRVNQELLATVAELRAIIEKQQAHIDRLVRMTFGRRSGMIWPTPDTLAQGFSWQDPGQWPDLSPSDVAYRAQGIAPPDHLTALLSLHEVRRASEGWGGCCNATNETRADRCRARPPREGAAR